jgi:hypothetical protein
MTSKLKHVRLLKLGLKNSLAGSISTSIELTLGASEHERQNPTLLSSLARYAPLNGIMCICAAQTGPLIQPCGFDSTSAKKKMYAALPSQHVRVCLGGSILCVAIMLSLVIIGQVKMHELNWAFETTLRVRFYVSTACCL